MTTSITLEPLDEPTLQRLTGEAKRRGVTVEQFALMLLRKALDADTVYHDLDSLAGTWTAQDASEFEAASAPQRVIDAELWR